MAPVLAGNANLHALGLCGGSELACKFYMDFILAMLANVAIVRIPHVQDS